MTLHPPYISYDDSVVYPVLKDEAAMGGPLNSTTPQKLIIDFNCLGVQVKTTMILHIEIPLHSPVKLYIDKECSKGICCGFNPLNRDNG